MDFRAGRAGSKLRFVGLLAEQTIAACGTPYRLAGGDVNGMADVLNIEKAQRFGGHVRLMMDGVSPQYLSYSQKHEMVNEYIPGLIDYNDQLIAEVQRLRALLNTVSK